MNYSGLECTRCGKNSETGGYRPNDNFGRDWYCTECLDEDYAKEKRRSAKCECGLDEALKHGASGGKHSTWCPKYIDE